MVQIWSVKLNNKYTHGQGAPSFHIRCFFFVCRMYNRLHIGYYVCTRISVTEPCWCRWCSRNDTGHHQRSEHICRVRLITYHSVFVSRCSSGVVPYCQERGQLLESLCKIVYCSLNCKNLCIQCKSAYLY